MASKTKRRLTPRQRLAAVANETQSILRERKLRAELDREKAIKAQAMADLEHAEVRGEILNELENVRGRDKWTKLSGKLRGKNSALIALSDWHVGEVVRPETVEWMNEYSTEIARRRIKRMFRWALRLIEQQSQWLPIESVYVCLLGDHVTGWIHEELKESSDGSPTESILVCKELICDGLDFLMREIKRPFFVSCNYGNHGRTDPKKKIGTGARNSFEWLMYKDLQFLYRKNPRIAFQVADGYKHRFQVQGHEIRAHHGDAFRFNGGTGGPTVSIYRKTARWNRNERAKPIPLLDVFGHLHTFMMYGDFLCNGSVIGPNAYGDFEGFSCERPCQGISWINRERGHVLSGPVYCDEVAA